MDGSTFVPGFTLYLDGFPARDPIRRAVMQITCKTGVEGVDQADIAFANEALQWLDEPLFSSGRSLALDLGSVEGGQHRVFTGEITGKAARMTATDGNRYSITAQDRRHNMADGTRTRWFAIPVPTVGNFPIPDPLIASGTTLEDFMVPLVEPVGATLAIVLGGLDAIAVAVEPGSAQKMVRKQADESNLDFLKRIARENGWDMVISHDQVGGHLLRFQSYLDRLDAEATYTWGLDMLEFESRMTKVGQLDVVSIALWVPGAKMTFTVSLGWDWDRVALTLDIFPGVIPLGVGADSKGKLKIDEPSSPFSAGRKLVAELLPRLNRRILGRALVPGNPRLKAGRVVQIDGAGAEFGGHYRIAELTHVFGPGGFTSEMILRKDFVFAKAPRHEGPPIRLSI